jgi:hypothetical protein
LRARRVLPHVFEDCAHWWALAHHCIAALDEIHALGSCTSTSRRQHLRSVRARGFRSRRAGDRAVSEFRDSR